jgi:hypothetical protein
VPNNNEKKKRKKGTRKGRRRDEPGWRHLVTKEIMIARGSVAPSREARAKPLEKHKHSARSDARDVDRISLTVGTRQSPTKKNKHVLIKSDTCSRHKKEENKKCIKN